MLEIQVLAWDRHTNVTGLNWLMGSQPPLLITGSYIISLFNLDGYYMYIETSGSRHAGDKAHLKSPAVSTDPSTKCLRFWYHMYGATIGQLNVYLRAGAGLGPAIWTRRGTQGNKWIQGQVVINKTSAFTVIFIIMI
jgi:hypothetical protein